MHDVDGLLKLIEVLLKMMMQICPNGSGSDPFSRTDKQRIVQLVTQPLRGLTDRGRRYVERFCCLADAQVLVDAFENDQQIEIEFLSRKDLPCFILSVLRCVITSLITIEGT